MQASSNQPLALTSILASALPSPLPNGKEDRYIVPVVFSRQPSALEAHAIVTASVQNALASAGYSGIVLSISDRRLLIANTNLAELAGGLATEIATLIDEISRNIATEQERRRAAAELEADELAAQAQEVTRAAERIIFVPRAEQ